MKDNDKLVALIAFGMPSFVRSFPFRGATPPISHSNLGAYCPRIARIKRPMRVMFVAQFCCFLKVISPVSLVSNDCVRFTSFSREVARILYIFATRRWLLLRSICGAS